MHLAGLYEAGNSTAVLLHVTREIGNKKEEAVAM